MNLAFTDNLSTRLAHALALIDEAIVDASSKLGSGPDNPAIKRHSDVPGLNAFSIRLSDIMKGGRSTSGKLDPFTHDWLAQYRYARELVEKRKFAALRDLLAGQTYRDLSHGLRTFAPEVIEHIKAITGDLRAAVELTDASRLARTTAEAQVGHTGRRARP
jgi:hypothetical protein